MQTPRLYLVAGLVATAFPSPGFSEDVGAGQEIYKAQ